MPGESAGTDLAGGTVSARWKEWRGPLHVYARGADDFSEIRLLWVEVVDLEETA